MKKYLLLFVLFAQLFVAANATVHVVQVANFQFSPSNMTDVFVGDIVRFIWVSGSHTTTDDPATQGAGNALPPGATPWNSPINSSNTSFDYTVTVAGLYKYYCIPHKDFGMIGQFTASVVTPVKLTSFLINGSADNVAVKWKTASEESVDHFSIYRSVNGSDYTEIAKIPAKGVSGSETSYAFTDAKISVDNKYYYYKVAAVDKDGKQTFSEIRLFKNIKSVIKLITSLSPNPITAPGHLIMTFNADKEGKMEVKLIDAQGKVVTTSAMQAYEGVNSGHFHVGNLPAGTYTLTCILNGVKETRRILVQ